MMNKQLRRYGIFAGIKSQIVKVQPLCGARVLGSPCRMIDEDEVSADEVARGARRVLFGIFGVVACFAFMFFFVHAVLDSFRYLMGG